MYELLELRSARNEEVSKSLLGLHALTGCDSVSAFKRRGKKSALNLVTAEPAIGNGLQHVGEDFVVTPNVHDVCEAFVCQLYNSRELNDVNKVRYNMFTSKAAISDQMPPTEDALQLHVARANYQAGIWRRELEGKMKNHENCHVNDLSVVE